MKIKNSTKLGTIIKEYPHLELTIASILPDYGNLEQPHLKEKVLSITTVEHLARSARLEVSNLIKDLEKVAGISSQEVSPQDTLAFDPSDPAWIQVAPSYLIDGVEFLSKGEHPLSIIKSRLEEMAAGELILLTTNFHPQPMIEAMQDQGLEIFSRKDINDQNLHVTFIKK